MEITKSHIDVGLFTNAVHAQLAFWGAQVGLEYSELLKIGGGIHQHRFYANGSVVKVNHTRPPLAPSSESGFKRLQLARDGIARPLQLYDPEGNAVLVVPRGFRGVVGVAVEMTVGNREEHDYFWRHVMQFDSPSVGTYLCGDSLIFTREGFRPARADSWRGLGWSYITIQVADCRKEHDAVMRRGGEEGVAPTTLGSVATISFVRDPDGNFVELSQRASLCG
jgi:lactoylglutathione lyase